MASALVTKLTRALRDRLPEFYSGLTLGSASDRVTGYIVSSAFTGQDHGERQARLRELIQEALTPEEIERIGPIVTMTPAEADITPAADETPMEAPKPKKRAG